MASIYNKIAWSEGLLLKPQHFQQQERYLEVMLYKQLQYLQGFYWGFYQFSLDNEALIHGKIALKEAKGIFKEGTSFNIAQIDPTPAPISCEESDTNKVVYLCIPREGESRYQITDTPELNRYKQREAEINDAEKNLIESHPIQLKQLNIQLKIGKASHEYDFLEIAKIKALKPDGGILLYEDFIAPSLRISASACVCEKLTHTLEAIKKLISPFKTIQRKSEYNSLIQYQYQSELSKHYHILNHYLNSPFTHPEKLFKKLLSFCSILSIIHQDELKIQNNYNHENLFSCLNPLFDFIQTNLRKNIIINAYKINLNNQGGGFWLTAKIPPEELKKTLLLSLEFAEKASLSAEECINHLKLGTQQTIMNLIKQALPGIKLHPIKNVPTAISSGHYGHHFEIDKQNELWKALSTEQNLVLYASHKLGNFKPQLWMLENQ